MQLYDATGELVSLSSSTVGYDEDGEDYQINEIPTFTAYIDYSGATIEDPGSQDYGYRDRSYTIEDFEVIALEGYASDYSLYYVDEDRLADDQTMPSYDECVDNAYNLFFAEGAPYANAVVGINVYNSDVSEDDDEWDDTDNAYQWNPDSSLSFTPQRSGIYLVNLTVTETTGATVSSYMAIEVRNPVDIIPRRLRVAAEQHGLRRTVLDLGRAAHCDHRTLRRQAFGQEGRGSGHREAQGQEEVQEGLI